MKLTRKEIEKIEKRMEKRRKRDFIRNHPDFPLYFSIVCLILVIFASVFRK